MCGIVGIASAYSSGFSKIEMDVFTDMLFLDTMRGFDSTGVFGVNKHSNVEIHKSAEHGLDFICTKEFKTFKESVIREGVFAVGHNRSATRGTITDKNAHPFWADDKIILVQNGTYRGDHKALKDTEVDTEAVAHVLAENDDVTTALKKVNASYALVWFNTDTKSLHLIRNTERPLFIVRSTAGSLIWASEAPFIQLACARNNLHLTDRPIEIPAHTLVTLTITGNKWEREDKPLDCGYVFPQTTSAVTNYTGLGAWGVDDDTDYETVETRVIVPPERTRTNIVPFVPRSRYSASVTSVARTMQEELYDKYPEYHMTRVEAITAADASRTLSRSRSHFIELVDYLPANDHPECTTWHVYGFLNCPDTEKEKTFKNVIFHWFMYNMTEEQVGKYVEQTWFLAEIRSVQSNMFNDKNSLVTVLMSNPLPVQHVEHPKNETTHVH